VHRQHAAAATARYARADRGATISPMVEPSQTYPHLVALGWRDDLPAAEVLPAMAPGRLARVIEQHRSGYKVTDGERDFPVQSPIAWARPGLMPDERAAVGDWVWLEPERDVLTELLPRQSLLTRGAAGEHYKQQLIAANVDTVFVVVGLDHDFNPRRLERYLLLVRGSGGDPVFVLTKADQCSDVAGAIASLTALHEAEVPVVAVNAKDRASVVTLEPWMGPGHTLVLVGSSGAGKSTLTNTLLGREKMKTAAVRGRDSRGRHTTTHRSLIPLPNGACLIDTPGMRELKLTGEEDLAEGGFEDVEVFTGGCRFSDCRHTSEPGCAVLAALESGALEARRWAMYRKLQDELAAAGQSLAAQRERRALDKTANKASGKRPADKYSRR
jgi:ribosome biogenesis GTPase / thiamine phosphate phosphatase